MQAARSAAIADGLIKNDRTDDFQKDDENSPTQQNSGGGSMVGVSSSAGYTNHNQMTILDANNNNNSSSSSNNRMNTVQNPAMTFYQATNSGGGQHNKPSMSAPIASHINPNIMSMSKPANSSGCGGSGKKKGPALRRGKWTAEEEAYANRLITEFKAGLLPLTDGTTLRTFLSKLLNCDPMRISKKFVGGNCIGKQVFRRRTADINRLTPEQIQQSRKELSE